MVCPVLGNTIKSFPQLAKLPNYSFQFYSFADGCGSGNVVHAIWYTVDYQTSRSRIWMVGLCLQEKTSWGYQCILIVETCVEGLHGFRLYDSLHLLDDKLLKCFTQTVSRFMLHLLASISFKCSATCLHTGRSLWVCIRVGPQKIMFSILFSLYFLLLLLFG